MAKSKKTHEEEKDWVEVWMKQSQIFNDIANQQLKHFFEQGHYLHPEKHMEVINHWLDELKKQWHFSPFGNHLDSYEKYHKLMLEMMSKSSQLLLQRWMAIAKTDQPVSNIRDLYELWLSCCHDVYSEEMHTKAYQDVYSEWMNNVVRFWKSMMPNK